MSERPNFYRDPELRKGIEKKARDIFGSREVSDDGIDQFFQLQGEHLSEAEKRDVGLFIEYVSKRLVNAALHRPGQEAKDESDAEKKLNDHAETFGFIPNHDPAHAIMTYERSDENSVVPTFFKKGLQATFLDPEALAEEFPALLWSGPVNELNWFTALFEERTSKKLFDVLRARAQASSDARMYLPAVEALEADLDRTDFDSVRRTFETFTILFLKTTSAKSMNTSIIREGIPAMDEALARTQAHPDERYLALARKIFDEYPSNKRVYFEEFKRIMAPLLERLRRKGAE